MRPLVRIVTPASAGSRRGNRVTALRWAKRLRELDLRVAIDHGLARGPADVLIALHAGRGAAAITGFRRACPGGRVVLALTGTDLYDEIARSPEARAALEQADRLVVLQPRGVQALPESVRGRTRAIFQSASAAPPAARTRGPLRAVMLAHLRAVKDPLLSARALDWIDRAVAVEIVHLGSALDPELERAAREAAARDPRWQWRGDVPRAQALGELAAADVVLVTSHLEGGANVVTEAIAAGVPVLSTRVEGSIGILGEGYPGYFPVGDARALAEQLGRMAGDDAWAQELACWCRRLRPLVAPARERECWAELLAELSLPVRSGSPSGRCTIEATPIEDERAALVRDVSAGLTADPKRLSCRFFYDREGSALFEEICRLPEYYLGRAEREILEASADAIVSAMPPGTLVLELGSGNAEKTRLLLDALCRRQSHTVYAPVDVSREMLDQTARALVAEQAALDVHAIAAEYAQGIAALERLTAPARLVLWLGSNIGNLAREAAGSFLASVRARLAGADRLLVGIDLRKDRTVLERAYHDSAGVTERFDRNLLVRINRELSADFDPDAFALRVEWQDEPGRVRSWLVSRRKQTVRIPRAGLTIDFAAGEAVHTEDSYKYSFAEIAALAAAARLEIVERWMDSEGRFALVCFRPG